MIRSILIGAVAGARSLSPLAAVAAAAWRRELPKDNGAPALLGHPLVAAGAMALAVGELAGDKMPSAPDRVVPAGLAVRLVTAGLAGAALAPKRERTTAVAAAIATAMASSYVTWRVRCAAMRRFGQVKTGAIEDALVLASTVALVRGAKPA